MRVVAYHGIGPVSEIIKKITRSDISHVAFLANNGSVYEAWENCGVVHASSISENHNPNTTVDIYQFKAQLNQQEQKKLLLYCEAMVGRRYDFENVFRFVTLRDKPDEPDHALFCSEYVAEGCHMMGRPLFSMNFKDLYKISPGDIVKSLELVYCYSTKTK